MSARPQAGKAARSNKLLIVFAFACVYLCWGSAFVAIRYSVQTIHPAFVAGVRYVVAALLLLGYMLIRGESLRISMRDLRQVMLLGLLMFSCNTLLLSYGGRELPAGLTALIISIIPLFIALLEAILPAGTPPTAGGWLGIVSGFLGIMFLLKQSIPERASISGQIPASIGLLIAAFAWALGSVLLNRMSFSTPMLVCTGWQMLIGGVVNVAIGFCLNGVQGLHAGSAAWLSVLFLAIFGTLAGYTSYAYLLRHAALGSVATYAYINPLIAVALGWIVLKEPVTLNQCLGMVFVLTSVAVVVTSATQQHEKMDSHQWKTIRPG